MRSTKQFLGLGAVLVFCALIAAATFRFSAPPPDLRLVLNIPASRLDVYEHGSRTRSYAISAGRREFATPPGDYRISRVIWNPWWHPPKSAWARNERPTPPGPRNPMGRVKIYFANLLYIHGTPHEDDLGIPASHGCIRISDRDVVELAHLIHKYRTPRVEPALLAKLHASRTMTRSFHIEAVPFEVAYTLVEIVDDKLIIHPDVYRRARGDLRDEIVATLKAAGIAISERIEKRLGSISRRRIATRLTIALDSLARDGAGD
ncbi:MAG: L,D-transpeptidase [Gemmatimonadota bacterium]